MAPQNGDPKTNGAEYKEAEMFALAVGWAETELSAIWARYNAFLVALTIAIFVIGAPDASQTIDINLKRFIAATGIVGCLLWGFVHCQGYKNFEGKLKAANSIYTGPSRWNPLPSTPHKIFDGIWWASMAMVLILIIIFSALLFLL